MRGKYSLPLLTAALIFLILLPVQLVTEPPLLLFERLFTGGGFLQIMLIAAFGFLLEHNMLIPGRSGWWRRFSWSLFSVIFFLQLILGIAVDRIFLMTGEMHLPVPALIISGPIYRGSFSVMTLIFLSAVLLSGPAWCSQYCYFGAIDSALAGPKSPVSARRRRRALKNTFLLLSIVIALLLRIMGASGETALAAGVITGVAGLLIIFFISRREKQMIHCTVWCPVGTLVSYIRVISPFRLKIREDCTSCMKCSTVCRYDALTRDDIAHLKPGITCTLCGDCISACRSSSIYYHFPGMSPAGARKLYITVTVVIYSLVLAMARI
ncbi:MAG: 4Fe-4S binding protein [Bacteroidales bacterium]|jgi:polyferredoxin|nr:4Fe-4S binding protein [Bacteroidales bacterium]